MTRAVPDILTRIVDQKKAELARAPRDREALESRAEASRQTRRSFATALTARHPAIIAEIKKASPSKGVLLQDFQPAAIAQAYEVGGAAALSVLTDREFFHGGLDDLRSARAATALPTLRKDFTIDEYHVLEAAAGGADAILLIAAILTPADMRHLRERAEQYGLDVLVEVHDADEVGAAIDAGARLIGVNNRNLHTFEVDLNTAVKLAGRMPKGALLVAESGIQSRDDVRRLEQVGYQAFLVGEHLMKSTDPARAIRALIE